MAAGFVGGIGCSSAGSLHPLSFTRELARTCLSKGVQIFSGTHASAVTRTNAGWEVKTEKDISVSAKQVLICTNGYTGNLIPGLKQKVVPVRSILIASEPLSIELRQEILPDQVTFVDKRNLILYARYDRDGRLCIGDLGPMRDAFCLGDFNHLKERAISVFPELKAVRWDFHWGGRIAMTRSSTPFIHEPAPGLICGMGYNGRGVGMGTVMGRLLAERALGAAEEEMVFPITKPASYPFHRFHRPGVKMGVELAKRRDKRLFKN